MNLALAEKFSVMVLQKAVMYLKFTMELSLILACTRNGHKYFVWVIN